MVASMSDVTRPASAFCPNAFASFSAPCMLEPRCSIAATSAARAGRSALHAAWNRRSDALSLAACASRSASALAPETAPRRARSRSAVAAASAAATRARDAASSSSPAEPSGSATGCESGRGVSTGFGKTGGPLASRQQTA